MATSATSVAPRDPLQPEHFAISYYSLNMQCPLTSLLIVSAVLQVSADYFLVKNCDGIEIRGYPLNSCTVSPDNRRSFTYGITYNASVSGSKAVLTYDTYDQAPCIGPATTQSPPLQVLNTQCAGPYDIIGEVVKAYPAVTNDYRKIT